ncbi:type VII secretion protein EccE [Amycolatopsis marina]|uniref:Type VII secretion protein EccE n=1 Tax=Amycolatopsis marina TaxID=490629 RepID=A0A1I1AES8_9PSEU|nr:type VII secretion protein EccE [Amycolatopsis marina]SFB35992.1 type VII secretion protein EccE [Amycolatopsis marina]
MTTRHQPPPLVHPQAVPARERGQRSQGRPLRTVAAAASVRAVPRFTTAVLPETAPVPVPTGSHPAVSMPSTTAACPPEPSRETQADAELPVLRIVCWQLALVLGFVAIGRPWPVALALGVAATALLAVTAVRLRGSWASTLLRRWLRLLLPNRRRDLTDARAPAALLELLAPGTRISTGTAELAGSPCGVLSRDSELLAILRPVRAGADEFARAALSGSLLPDPDQALPVLRLQLVLHRGPQGPAVRAWLAVRALRQVDVADDTELRTALSNTIRRMRRRLRNHGLEAAVLAEQDMLATLTALTHVGPGRGAIREDWSFWRTGPVAQVGLRLSGPTPGRDRVRLVGNLLAAVPGVAFTAALVPGEPGLVLRLASTSEAVVNAAALRLTGLGPALDMRIDRLDGLHGPATAATLPIGGNPL